MRFLLSFFVMLLISQAAHGFPDSVRHGYVNCGACHVSASGGGTLTPYGRGMSAEFMSTWAREDEGQPLHGAVKRIPESLLIGGGFRSIQTYSDAPKYRRGRYFIMQSDVELGWAEERVTVLAGFGLNVNSPATDDDDEWVSARHFVGLSINDNVNVRVGRFMKNYGLSIANHTAQIRRGLGWDEFSETYNVEVNYLTETYDLSLTGIGGRPDDDKAESEKGIAVSGQFLHLEPNIRLGGSYFAAQATDATKREIFGPHFAWGVTKSIFLLGEYDWVRVSPKTGELVEGYVTYTQAGMELVRGLDLTLMHEMRKSDRQQKKIDFQGYGPGVRWQPRPHFIFTGQWQKQKRPQQASLIDSAWFVLQYWI